MAAQHRRSQDERARWASSGLLALTGDPSGPGLVAPAPLVRAVESLARAVDPSGGVDALALLAERAAVAGLTRRGTTSCGGATRLLRTSDEWLALSLARPDDVDLVPAWLERDLRPAPAGADDRGGAADDLWSAIASVVAGRSAAELVDRARLLSLPAARLGESACPPEGARPPRLAGLSGGRTARPGVVARRLADGPPAGVAPLVVDLSSLWAGPLCARLLGEAGAQAVKVESVGRPDGARRGPAAFYDRLHAGHRSVALDFGTEDGRASLRRLVAAADVVIEASRPRALAQLGVDAEAAVRDGGVRAWVSITGYGRAQGGVAFGDDAAVAGGLVAWGADGRPRFVADAVADPLTGLAAAGAALAALRSGGRWSIDVSMAHVAAEVAVAVPPGTPWPPGTRGEATPPRPGRPAAPAPHLGAHTAAVLRELAPR